MHEHDELIDALGDRGVRSTRVFQARELLVQSHGQKQPSSTWIAIQTPGSWAWEWTSKALFNSKILFSKWAMGCKFDSVHDSSGIHLCVQIGFPHPHSDVLYIVPFQSAADWAVQVAVNPPGGSEHCPRKTPLQKPSSFALPAASRYARDLSSNIDGFLEFYSSINNLHLGTKWENRCIKED